MIGLKSLVRRLVMATAPGVHRLIQRCPWLMPFAVIPEQIEHIARVRHHRRHKLVAGGLDMNKVCLHEAAF